MARCLRWLTKTLVTIVTVLTLASPMTTAFASGPGTSESGGGLSNGVNQLCLAGGSNSDDNSNSDSNSKGGNVPKEQIKVTVDGDFSSGPEAAHAVAKAIGEKLNMDPGFVYAQMKAESGNFDNPVNVRDKNLSGIKGSGGSTVGDGAGAGWESYQHFDTWSDYASEYASILVYGANPATSSHPEKATSLEDFCHRLKQNGYFEDNEAHYLSLLQGGYAEYNGGAAAGIGKISGETAGDSTDGGSGDVFNYVGDEWGDGGADHQDDEQKTDQQVGDGNVKTVYDTMIKDGLSSTVASAIIGNLMQESGPNLDPKATNPSSGAHGIGQWLGGRLSGLEAYAQSVGKDKDDLATQVDYLLKKDLPAQKTYFGGDSGLMDFMHMTDLDAATAKWESAFERSGGSAVDARKTNARAVYQKYGQDNKSADDSKLQAFLGGVVDAANAGASNDQATDQATSQSGCKGSSDDSTSAVAGDWGWPYKSIKNKEDVYNNTPWRVQKFGMTRAGAGINGDKPFHDGWDFQGATWGGQDLLAVHGGEVYKIEKSGDGRGLHIDIKSPDGYYETYQEGFDSMSDIKVKVGDNVKTGDVLGKANRDHMHVGISKTEIEAAQSKAFTDDGTWLNPVRVIAGLPNPAQSE